MANRRPNSCPDAWKHASDFSGDRPKSVLAAQQDSSPAEETFDTEKEPTASENSELNKAKVNPWIESKDKEKTNPSGSKLFYHYPQRRVSPGIASETTGMSRPQTEPGRTRNQMLPDDVKTLARQSVHDVASASTGTGTEKEESEEGWVMVEKSTSETVMPCDPEDESNVLVPSPNKKTEEAREDTENVKLGQRTQMLLANKFGSTFKVLPEARDKATSETGRESSGISGVASKPKFIAAPSTPRTGQVSMGNMLTFASSVSKWKNRKLSNKKTGFATLDPELRQLLAVESDNMKTEVPEAMMRTIQEEAYRIVLKTTQAYSSQIGSKHKLTSEAYDSLKELMEDLLRI